AGIEDGAGVDLRDLEAYVGTSAGSIVAARLAGGARLRRPPGPVDEAPAASETAADGLLRTAARWGWAATAPLAPLAAAVAARPGRGPSTGGSHARLAASIDALAPRFDGRLRVCCVDKGSGRRVVFGAPGAPPATVGQAVAASCAIPWVFAPVRIGERDYVDG